MSLPAPTNADIQRIVDLVVAEVNPLRVVLFGSAARGEQSSRSDVDLMVIVPDGVNRLHVAQKLHLALGKQRVMVPVDFVVATPSLLARYDSRRDLVYRQALTTGRELYAA